MVKGRGVAGRGKEVGRGTGGGECEQGWVT